MRRILLTILLLTGSAALRAENTARQLASSLKGILADYQKQVDKKISAEQDAYEQAARLYASSQDERAFQSLTVDRLALAMSTAAELIDGRITVNELLFDQVPAYARQDFDRTKVVFAEQAESYRAFLVNLESLSVEKKKAQALSAVLDEMSRKTKLVDQLKSVEAFRQATATQMKFSDCALSVSRLAIFNGQKDRLADRAKSPTLAADEKTRIQNDLDSVNKRIASLEAERNATGLFDPAKKSCKTPQ
jgi:hypothetical protein